MSGNIRPRRLTVDDVMTHEVITASESATFHELAELMQRHRISALPIVDLEGRVIGIVSEADLLPKEAPPAARHLWQRQTEKKVEQAKAAGVTAAEVMTSPVVSAAPDETLAVAARRMLDRDVKRLPVLADGALVGVVSRRDVLRSFRRDDEEIRRDIVEGVLPRWMGLDPSGVDVLVAGGMVLLRGGLERRSEIDILVHLVTGLDGVTSVQSELRYELDDSNMRPATEARIS